MAYGTRKQRWVSIHINEVERETDKAFLLNIHVSDNSERDVWIPKSQMKDPDSIGEGDEGVEVEISEWIAGQNDIETDYTNED